MGHREGSVRRPLRRAFHQGHGGLMFNRPPAHEISDTPALVLELIRELEAEREATLSAAAGDRSNRQIAALQQIRGIGANFAAVLVHEVFYRGFENRRQLASYVGIAP